MLQTAPVFPQFSVRYMLFGSSYLNRACQGHIYFQNVFILEPKSLKTLHAVIWDLLKKFLHPHRLFCQYTKRAELESYRQGQIM